MGGWLDPPQHHFTMSTMLMIIWNINYDANLRTLTMIHRQVSQSHPRNVGSCRCDAIASFEYLKWHTQQLTSAMYHIHNISCLVRCYPLDFRETQTEEATIIIIIGQQKSQRLITICMKPLRSINRSTRKDHRLNVCLAAALPILVQRRQNLTHPSFHHVIYLVYHFTTKWRWYEWTNALASTL